MSTFSPEYEDLPEVTTGEGTASGTVIDGLQSLEFTNVFSKDASLEISKVRDGGSVNDVFTYNVMIDGNPFAGQYTVFNEEGNKEGIYSTDDGKVQIKGGGRIYITGLEVDAAYEISEDPARNYIGANL